jgi:hypothetical protein
MMPTRMQGFTKKRPRVFMTKWLQKRSFMLETKSFFIIHVWNFFLESCAIVGLDPSLFLMFFYGAVRIISVETNKVLRSMTSIKTFFMKVIQ